MMEVEVEALKPFNRTPQGDMVHPGDPPFMVGKVRAGELEANGLARRIGTKVKPVPANKMNPVPDNKVAPGPKPVAVTRRSPRQAETKLSGGDQSGGLGITGAEQLPADPSVELSGGQA